MTCKHQTASQCLWGMQCWRLGEDFGAVWQRSLWGFVSSLTLVLPIVSFGWFCVVGFVWWHFLSALDVLVFSIKLTLYSCTKSVYLYKLFEGSQPVSAFIYVVVNPEQFSSYFFEKRVWPWQSLSKGSRVQVPTINGFCCFGFFLTLFQIQGSMSVVKLY